jgi:hypothetical protein
MESRFGHDFGQVRVHTDERAALSAKSIQALAYTAGHDIVFGTGQYAAHTERGKRLLAHELAHVVQQRAGEQRGKISRFSDDTHNIIDEVASTLAGMKPEEIEQIHKGNTRRDYSQSPGVMNLALMCNPSTFGGYADYEHFDNFQWSEELQAWRSRDQPGNAARQDPISHIEKQFMDFVQGLPDKAAFQHVGNAFHAIEDFFAHSNFVDLTHGDFTHGKELITGSVGGSDDVSLYKILESVSSEETAPYYGGKATKGIEDAPAKSHAKMAKDYKSNRYHTEAIVLAGLVIKEIASGVIAMKAMSSKEERMKYVREHIMATVKRYLRPPNPQDKWWESLRESGGAEMEKAIQEQTAKTPVTVNQCVLSPMRSIEASKDSNLKLFGPTFNVPTKYGNVWVQVGSGFATGPAFTGPTGDVLPRSAEAVPVGVQVGGRF